MKENKEVKISYWAAHLTTVISVTLVLLIVGIIAMISIGAATETARLKEKLELSVILKDSVSDASADSLRAIIAAKPYCLEASTISKAEALKNWTDDTGENLEELFGVNPLSPEISLRLKADCTTPQSIKNIERSLASITEVESISAPDTEMMDRMNSNIETAAIVLGAIALILILISFVLINNTVHLAIYSRRFTIHTMQLVGATNSFIRRPFLKNNLLAGIISGLVASSLIAIALAAGPGAIGRNITFPVSWIEYAFVAGALVIIGGFICTLSALFATTHYLHKDYDQLFK